MASKGSIGDYEDGYALKRLQELRKASKLKPFYNSIFAVNECPLPDEELFQKKSKPRRDAEPDAGTQNLRITNKGRNGLTKLPYRRAVLEDEKLPAKSSQTFSQVEVQSKNISTTDENPSSLGGIWNTNTIQAEVKVATHLLATYTSKQETVSKSSTKITQIDMLVHNQSRDVSRLEKAVSGSALTAHREQTHKLDKSRKKNTVISHIKTTKRAKRDDRLSVSCHNIQHSVKSEGKLTEKKTEVEHSSGLSREEPKLVSIKVEDRDSNEIMTYEGVLLRMKKKYPRLVEIIPEIGAQNKEIKWSQNAVHLVLKFVFAPHLNSEALSNGKTAVEAFAAAQEWGITEFGSKLQPHFLQNLLSKENMDDFYSLADYLGDHELCLAIRRQKKKVTGDSSLTKGTAKYRPRTCSVSCQLYVEPLEFIVPLISLESHTLDEDFSKDISCQIIFHSVLGSFAIRGFQMSFGIDSNATKDFPKLKIHYNLKNLQNEDYSINDQKEKPFRPKVILNFKKDFIVKQGQKCEISVDTEVKPFWCLVPENDKLVHTRRNAKFQLDIKSNFKVKRENKMRFFIEKLFYLEVDDTEIVV